MLLHCYCADVLLSPASALLNSGRLHRTSNFWLQPSSGARRSTSAHRHDCLPGPMIYNQPTRNVRPRIPTGVESSATYIVARRRRQGWAIRDRSAVEGSPIPAAALAYIPMDCLRNFGSIIQLADRPVDRKGVVSAIPVPYISGSSRVRETHVLYLFL